MSEEFKPYIPAEENRAELTLTAIVLGMLLAIIFGAANAYLGLRLGTTISSSIPAAVISMGVIRGLLRRNSILENNIVQSIASAGGSVASGAIFTIPVMFFWAHEGSAEMPSMITITLLSLCGGCLGVFFMVPLRKALIVKEHLTLPYPEGTACAKVLLAGENRSSGGKILFRGISLAAVFKLLTNAFCIIPETVGANIKILRTKISVDPSAAFIGVGYICGPRVASYLFSGGMFAWFVLIPAITLFGADTVLYPGTVKISELYASSGSSAVWSSYIRYIGAGAIATAGIINLCKTIPTIAGTFLKSFGELKNGSKNIEISGEKRTEQDLSNKILITGIILTALVLFFTPQIPVAFAGTVLIIIFGFFFSCVSSRMVGLIGSTNNPTSSMTIATLIISTTILKLTGDTGAHGMMTAITIGAVICTIASMAGDTSQDLKTGYIVGATPKKQQISEFFGVTATAVFVGAILVLLEKAWGLGSQQLPAPQATMMKMIIEGMMQGSLPWDLIFIGVFITLVIELLRIPSMPFALGIYLPLNLTAAMMSGGVVRLLVDKHKEKTGNTTMSENDNGVLFCSGLIAGEGIIGVLLAFLAITEILPRLNLSETLNTGILGGIVMLALIMFTVFKTALSKQN